jgi:hypothetical protein
MLSGVHGKAGRNAVGAAAAVLKRESRGAEQGARFKRFQLMWGAEGRAAFSPSNLRHVSTPSTDTQRAGKQSAFLVNAADVIEGAGLDEDQRWVEERGRTAITVWYRFLVV